MFDGFGYESGEYQNFIPDVSSGDVYLEGLHPSLTTSSDSVSDGDFYSFYDIPSTYSIVSPSTSYIDLISDILSSKNVGDHYIAYMDSSSSFYVYVSPEASFSGRSVTLGSGWRVHYYSTYSSSTGTIWHYDYSPYSGITVNANSYLLYTDVLEGQPDLLSDYVKLIDDFYFNQNTFFGTIGCIFLLFFALLIISKVVHHVR